MARFKSCLIVTYGRSGSTLLQGVLNTIPGWLIRGENENFAFHLFRAHGALQTAQAHPYTTDTTMPTDPWYGVQAIDLAGVRADCGTLIRNALVPPPQRETVRCFGFKEIRYLYMPEELGAYLDFIHDALPDMAVVFNFRTVENVLNSAWWRESDHADTTWRINNFERAALGYHLTGKAPSHIVRYEEILRYGQSLRALFDFLDEPIDYGLLDQVFATLHSTRTEPTGQPA